jgi:hypothetical protein
VAFFCVCGTCVLSSSLLLDAELKVRHLLVHQVLLRQNVALPSREQAVVDASGRADGVSAGKSAADDPRKSAPGPSHRKAFGSAGECAEDAEAHPNLTFRGDAERGRRLHVPSRRGAGLTRAIPAAYDKAVLAVHILMGLASALLPCLPR